MLSSGAILALGVPKPPAAGAPVDLAGGLAPAVAFAANLTVATGVPANYVDFTGNLGGTSSYGRLKYGRGHYSRIDAFAPAFSAVLDIVGQDFFDGDLKPVVTFAGDLTFARDIAGDLAPSVTFAANLGLVVDLAGDMAPQVALGASLSLDLAFDASLDGAFAFTVLLAASSMISGPLWASSEPCPASPWAPSKSCPPSLWTPIDPCDPVEWKESALCNG